jgi:hypothetical protein
VGGREWRRRRHASERALRERHKEGDCLGPFLSRVTPAHSLIIISASTSFLFLFSELGADEAERGGAPKAGRGAVDLCPARQPRARGKPHQGCDEGQEVSWGGGSRE